MAKDKLLRHIDVGGKIIRLVETPDYYFLFEGKRTIYKIVKKYINRKTLWQLTTDYSKYLKDMQEEFVDGDMPEDKLVLEAEKRMRDEFTKRLRDFFKDISKSKVEKEAFLGDSIFPKLTKVFSGFNKFINDMVGDVLKKMDVQVVNDVDDTGDKTPIDVKKLINDKRKLMTKSISDQVKTTKDNILQDIKKDLSSGMQAGQQITQIQRDIEKKYNYKNGTGWKAKRTLRTELNSANNLMKLKKWQKMGFEEVEHITRADERTCKICRPLNHKVFKIEDLLKNKKKRNPQHPNCRCSYVIY